MDVLTWFLELYWVFKIMVLVLVWCVGRLAAGLAFRLGNRILRTVKVCARGWPPAHLDADGDWKPRPKPKKEE